MISQQTITWTNVDPDLWCHMVSLGHNELTPVMLYVAKETYKYIGISHHFSTPPEPMQAYDNWNLRNQLKWNLNHYSSVLIDLFIYVLTSWLIDWLIEVIIWLIDQSIHQSIIKCMLKWFL